MNGRGHAMHQQGTVLVISLVLLLLLSLLGTSAMQSALLQERMAGNSDDLSRALQAAEAALRSGEDWLADANNRRLSHRATPLYDAAGWNGRNAEGRANLPDRPDSPVFHVGPPQQVIHGISLSSRYIEEFYPVTACACGSFNFGADAESDANSAAGAGQGSGSRVILQSIFRADP